MKRTDITAIVLGSMAFAFFLPFAMLFAGVIAFVLARTTNGIAGGAGGFSFAFSFRRTLLLMGLIVCLPILVGWLSRRIARARG